MILATMITTDEGSLICDLAETYRILDYRGLSPKLVATLSCGLRDNSRIKMKMSGATVTTETLLQGVIADKVSWLAWAQTEDAQKNRNRPESYVKMLMGEQTGKSNDEIMTFGSLEDFLAEWERE